MTQVIPGEQRWPMYRATLSSVEWWKWSDCLGMSLSMAAALTLSYNFGYKRLALNGEMYWGRGRSC